MISDTELRLSFWRDGSTQSERLAAATLRLSGYEELDPQSPLGGPDGTKDILCRKGGLTWVAAVYFPNGPKGFSAIKKKYRSDLSGVNAESQGFVFVTNQTLSPTQRKTLTDIAQAAGKEADVLHLQQLVTLLESPPGYGVRLQYLDIAMTIEDQLSWFLDSDSQVAKAVATNTRELLGLRASIDRLKTDQSQILHTLGLLTPASAATPDLISVSSFQKKDNFEPVSAQLSPGLILVFHRLICFDLPARVVGQLRTSQVWFANGEGQRVTRAGPPDARELRARLEELCHQWRADYPRLADGAEKLTAIARFHASFLFIHPFFDGNGRVARAILMQQCLDLFGRAEMNLMKKGADYYMALQKADEGDYSDLALLLRPIVAG